MFSVILRVNPTISVPISLFASLSLPRHFARDQIFNVLQLPHDFLLKSILTTVSLPLEKTGKHFSNEPAERTMRHNDGRIWFCNYFFHIYKRRISGEGKPATTLELAELASLRGYALNPAPNCPQSSHGPVATIAI